MLKLSLQTISMSLRYKTRKVYMCVLGALKNVHFALYNKYGLVHYWNHLKRRLDAVKHINFADYKAVSIIRHSSFSKHVLIQSLHLQWVWTSGALWQPVSSRTGAALSEVRNKLVVKRSILHLRYAAMPKCVGRHKVEFFSMRCRQCSENFMMAPNNQLTRKSNRTS